MTRPKLKRSKRVWFVRSVPFPSLPSASKRKLAIGRFRAIRPTPADSLSVSVFSTANSFSLLSVSVPVSSRLRICTPHAVYDSWGPRAAASACSLVRRGERNRGKGECRYTACVLRRRMRRLLESEIVTQSVYNRDTEWDGECCWSWSNGRRQ